MTRSLPTRLLHPLAAVLVLTGCGQMDFAGMLGLDQNVASSRAMGFTGLTATGADGYCVVPGVSGSGGTFALLGACAALGADEPYPLRNGIVSIQVGAADTALVAGGEDALLNYLQDGNGAALLSGGGAISITSADAGDERVTVSYDLDTGDMPDIQNSVWRGFVDLEGRLVTVSVKGLSGAPLDLADGLALLDATLDALEAANTGPASPT